MDKVWIKYVPWAMTDMFHSFTWTEMKIPYELPRASAHQCP